MDKFSAARLIGLHQVVVERFTSLDSQLELQNIILRIERNPIRSWAMQQTEWAKGRDASGNIVNPVLVTTHAPPGHSWHQYAFAFDGVPLINGLPDWNVSDETWHKVYAVANSVGLLCGRQFQSFKGDNDHFQPQELPESPTDEDVQLLRDGGMVAVWAKYFPAT